jgi:hypothetical protein
VDRWRAPELGDPASLVAVMVLIAVLCPDNSSKQPRRITKDRPSVASHL